MSYYQGDYRGDWYGGAQGDPFLGSLFGLAARGIKGIIGKIRGPGAGAIVKSFPGVGAIERVGSKVGGIIRAHPVLSGAGAAGVIAAVGAGAERMIAGPGMGARGPKGFHACKSKHGCKSGAWVRNRRMNPCNPRALRRAIRRAHSFEKLARHVIGFSSPRKPKGHMYFKRKRKK
jgi:hypothetical protein